MIIIHYSSPGTSILLPYPKFRKVTTDINNFY